MKQYLEEIITLLREIKSLLIERQNKNVTTPENLGRQEAERAYMLGCVENTPLMDRFDFASQTDFEAYVESFNKTFEELSVNDLVDEPDWLT